MENVRSLCFLANDHKELAFPAFLRHSKPLDPVQCGRIEVQKMTKDVEVPLLPADQLNGRGGKDRSPEFVRLVGSSSEILDGLRNSPDTRIPFPGGAKQLDHNRSQTG